MPLSVFIFACLGFGVLKVFDNFLAKDSQAEGRVVAVNLLHIERLEVAEDLGTDHLAGHQNGITGRIGSDEGSRDGLC